MAVNSIDTSKIVQAGEANVIVCLKEVESTAQGTVEMGKEDVIGYLSETGSFGESSETKEFSLYHFGKIKQAGTISRDDVELTEALTLDMKEKRISQQKQRKTVALALFNKEGEQLEGVYAQITKCSRNYSEGDFCKLTYTVSPSMDVTCTYSEV